MFFRILDLKLALGYLQNMMVCIDAGISGSFDGLNVTVAVSADIFLDKLNTLMLGLSQDNLNIDFQLYTEFLTYYIEGETSLYILQSLTRKVHNSISKIQKKKSGYQLRCNNLREKPLSYLFLHS